MKYSVPVLVLTVILAAGCVHKVPLTTEHDLDIDSRLVGLWEKIPAKAKGDPGEDRMVVLEWSDTEYLAQHPMGGKGEFYRAYLVEIGGHNLIQAASIGNSAGRQFPPERMVYPILTYEIVEGILVISTLNPEIVGDDIADSETLRQVFLENKDRQDLFGPPSHFRRVQDR